jgi:hypothetical protein
MRRSIRRVNGTLCANKRTNRRRRE